MIVIDPIEARVRLPAATTDCLGKSETCLVDLDTLDGNSLTKGSMNLNSKQLTDGINVIAAWLEFCLDPNIRNFDAFARYNAELLPRIL